MKASRTLLYGSHVIVSHHHVSNIVHLAEHPSVFHQEKLLFSPFILPSFSWGRCRFMQINCIPNLLRLWKVYIQDCMLCQDHGRIGWVHAYDCSGRLSS